MAVKGYVLSLVRKELGVGVAAFHESTTVAVSIGERARGLSWAFHLTGPFGPRVYLPSRVIASAAHAALVSSIAKASC